MIYIKKNHQTKLNLASYTTNTMGTLYYIIK